MTDPSTPEVPPQIARWPFYLGDGLLLLVAVVCYAHGQHWPFGPQVGLAPWQGWLFTVCISLGATLAILPHLLEYQAGNRLAEFRRTQQALQRFRNIDQISRQIQSATAAWQAIQDDASKAVNAAHELATQMSAEAHAFQDFLQRSHDAERSHLRLEVEKLRRAEGDWLQVLVRLLDNVWALYQAAVRSGKVSLVEQLSHFQRTCRDAAQRIGLVPLVPKAGDPFDPELHQPGQPPPPDLPEPKVRETLATGFRFQGQLVRKALVLLQTPVPPSPEDEPALAQSPSATQPDNEPAAPGQTEFTRKLTSGFREAADTDFVRHLAANQNEPNPGSREGA
jgi:molecular chaperone GrpE (heat shock protein)